MPEIGAFQSLYCPIVQFSEMLPTILPEAKISKNRIIPKVTMKNSLFFEDKRVLYFLRLYITAQNDTQSSMK